MSPDTNFYIIRCFEDLQHLKSFKSIFHRLNAVKFDIEILDPEVSANWEQKINRYYKACGCGEGKFFVFVFFLFGIGWKYMNQQLYLTWSTVGFVFAMCLMGAFLGKVFGQYLAFRKLRRMIDQLENSNWDFMDKA